MTAPVEPQDGMTLAEYQAARQVLRSALQKFEQRAPTCLNCTHFAMGECTQFGDVPAEFQKTPEACPSWVYDGIPF